MSPPSIGAILPPEVLPMANDASFFALRDALRTLRDLLPQLGAEVLDSKRLK